MRLIYMQDTIDYFHKVNPDLLNDLVKYGEPEIKEINKEEYIRYYSFDIY